MESRGSFLLTAVREKTFSEGPQPENFHINCVSGKAVDAPMQRAEFSRQILSYLSLIGLILG